MIVQYMAVNFIKSKFSSLTGETRVSFTEDSGSATAFSVIAAPSGLWFEGQLQKKISTTKELNEFARLVADGWKEHQRLAPKIVTSASGH